MANLPLLILLLATNGWSAPADEPIRVELPVYDQPEAASVLLAHPLEPENHGGLRNDKSFLGNLIPQKQDTNVQRSQTLPAGTVNVQGGQGWLAEPVSTLEGALLEAEGLGSKGLSVKDNLHGVVAGLFQPKPIVDTIKEEEKYGNNGDKFYTAGRAIVGGAEGVSNLINSALEVPGSIFMKIARAASEKLNNLGGRLIGL